MPALPPVPGVIKFVLHWTVGADISAVTIQYFRYIGGTPAAADVNGLCANTQANAQIAFQTLAATDVTLTEVEGIDLSSSTGAHGSHAAAWTGTRAGAILPANACANIRLAIARHYRGGKPKQFMPLGVDADLATTQTWSGAFIGAVGTGYQTYLTDQALNTAGTTQLSGQANVSYYQGFTVVTSPTTGRARNVPKQRTTPLVDTVTSASLVTTVGSQRRRLRS